MKRSHGSSDSLGALMSMCPTADGHSPGRNHMYLSMLDGFEDEGCAEETGQKKRRLSVDQVKALERNFEKENKLEPERKIKLAQDLGLQPRQVAVWFQNRRARWKTKQLERDYGVLKSNFDALNHNYESLQHEKESLLQEIKELRSKVQEEKKSTESNLSLSIKEEALLSDHVSKHQTMEASNTINPPVSLSPNEESEGANLNFLNEKNASLMEDFKDGSSDSDSSAILNDDRSPNASNHQILMSSSPPSINCFAITDSGLDGLGASQNNNMYHPQFVKMEEHNFFGGEETCNFFSDEQAPTLHWYCSDQWS